MEVYRFQEEEQSILARYREETRQLTLGLKKDVKALQSLDTLVGHPLSW